MFNSNSFHYFVSAMIDHSIELTKKMVASFEDYFAVVPDDHLLATIVNPMLAIRGFADMKLLL